MTRWGGMMQWWERSPLTSVTRVRCWPNAISGLSLLLVLALLRGFLSGYSGCPPSTKTNISKFQFDQDREPAWKPAKADVASSLNVLFYFWLYFCVFSNSSFVYTCPWSYKFASFLCVQTKCIAALKRPHNQNNYLFICAKKVQLLTDEREGKI